MATMVLAYHLVLSAYGFWLPNDPRGSWSEFVRSYELYRVGGKATKVQTRRSVAHRPYDPNHRHEAQQALVREPVRLTGEQARAVARGFADYCRRTDCRLHACAILRNHVHLVVGRRTIKIERTCELLKGAATQQLNREGLHPFEGQPYNDGRLPTPWARKGWWVFLDRVADIDRAVRYVNANPKRAGLPPQRWWFVTPFGG